MFKNKLQGIPKLKNIFMMGFLLALHLAFTAYINSSFLSAFSGEKNVGLIFMAGSLFSILLLLFVPRLLDNAGAYKFLLSASALNALSLLLLAMAKSPYLAIPVFILYFTLNNLIIFALDELVQIFSRNSKVGRVRGLYLMIINLAWVISQTVSGRTLSNFSFSVVYLVGFAIMLVFFLTAYFSLKNLEDPIYDKVLAWQSFRNFFSSKNLARSYALNFLLQFFFALMVIYTPIYLYAHLGFNWKEIGAMFTVMLLPFVLMSFPLGKYSDKIGERKMLMAGFLVTAIATLSLFFIKRHEVWIWALALFSTRVGAAIIEVMADVYFFKHITSENDEFISIYRNTGPVSYILAPLAASLMLLLTPSFNYIFLVLGALVLYGVYLSSTIQRSDI